MSFENKLNITLEKACPAKIILIIWVTVIVHIPDAGKKENAVNVSIITGEWVSCRLAFFLIMLKKVMTGLLTGLLNVIGKIIA